MRTQVTPVARRVRSGAKRLPQPQPRARSPLQSPWQLPHSAPDYARRLACRLRSASPPTLRQPPDRASPTPARLLSSSQLPRQPPTATPRLAVSVPAVGTSDAQPIAPGPTPAPPTFRSQSSAIPGPRRLAPRCRPRRSGSQWSHAPSPPSTLVASRPVPALTHG
jgi:hypothetical protein